MASAPLAHPATGVTSTPPAPPRRRSSFGSSASLAQQLLAQATPQDSAAHAKDASRSSMNTVVTHSSQVSSDHDANATQEPRVESKPLPPLPSRTTIPKPATPAAPVPAPNAASAPAPAIDAAGLTPFQRFQALDAAAFKVEFGMDRAAFEALPTWKQQRMRKERKLF